MAVACRFRRIEAEAAAPLHMLLGSTASAARRSVRPAPQRFGSMKALHARLPTIQPPIATDRRFLSAQLAARPAPPAAPGPMPLPAEIVKTLDVAAALGACSQASVGQHAAERRRRKPSMPRCLL